MRVSARRSLSGEKRGPHRHQGRGRALQEDMDCAAEIVGGRASKGTFGDGAFSEKFGGARALLREGRCDCLDGFV